MIELKKIKRESNRISCEAFVEDSPQPVSIVYDILSDQFDEGALPVGYEWCKAHIGYAERYIKEIKNERDVPKAKVIMWY